MCVNQLVQIVVFLCLSTLGVLCSQRGLRIYRHPKNHTVMADVRLKLFCKTMKQDMKVDIKIKWFRNGEELPHDEFWDLTRKGAVLRFTNVKVHHRGKYKCRAESVENNIKETVESNPAFLIVHAPVVIMNKMRIKRDRRLSLDSEMSIVCEAAGIPFPVVEWRKNGQVMFNSEGDHPYEKKLDSRTSDATLSSVLRVTVKESALYTCFASNNPIAGTRNDSIDVRVIALQPPRDMQTKGHPLAQDESQHVCAPYKGTFCKEFLQGRKVHHANLNTSSGMGDTEGMVVSLWEEVEGTSLMTSHPDREKKDFCRLPAKRLLCHVAFPDCDNETEQPRSVCRESCLSVKTLFCFRPWTEVEEMKLKGKYFKNKGSLNLPDCMSLPSKWNTSQACTESDHHQYSPAKVSDSCYVDHGRWYNGSVNVTVSGHVCQAWSANYPQKHDRSPQIFPELLGAENFCRNPGEEEDQPWCYTTDRLIRWEKCNVMRCGMTANNINTFGEKMEDEDDVEDFVKMVGVVAAASVVFVILVIVVAMMIWRRCGRPRYNATPQDDMEIDLSNVPVNSAYHQLKSNRLDPKLETLEFPRNDIEYIRDLGQGAFGRVFQARLICSNGNSHITGGKLSMSGSKYSLNWEGKHCKHSSKSISASNSTDLSPLPKDCNSSLLNPQFTRPVHSENEELHHSDSRSGQLIAVKMLKEDASDVVQADFEREASLMVNFDHPNIVRLLGVCTVGKPMCLLFEYMSKGDLNEFLRQCSLDQCLIPSNNDSIQRVAKKRTKLELVDQLSISCQIASGMAYLSDRGYVHRDLATRNCLVSSGLIVKIADFGLARSVHSVNYYRGSDKDAIPIRWMPPESILYNKFSSQSDVWSFGVLLWEIFSYALQPYYGMTHEEVINYLCDNKVLQCPDNTPSPVYDLMTSCWKRKPKERPNFSILHRSLTVMCEDRLKSETQQSLNV